MEQLVERRPTHPTRSEPEHSNQRTLQPRPGHMRQGKASESARHDACSLKFHDHVYEIVLKFLVCCWNGQAQLAQRPYRVNTDLTLNGDPQSNQLVLTRVQEGETLHALGVPLISHDV